MLICKRMIAVAVAVCGLFVAQASALPTPFSVTTAAGNGADSFIRLGQANTNFGAQGGVVVKDSNAGSTTRLGYLRFDLSGSSNNFNDATLTLDVVTNNQGGGGSTPQVHTVNIYGLNDGVGENWGEGTITFNNAPGNGPTEFVNADTTLLGTITVPAVATPNTINFQSGALAAFLNQDTDGQATIILQRDGGNGGHNLVFSSKEGAANAPMVSGSLDGDRKSISTAVGFGADSFIQSGSGANTNHGANGNVVIKHTGTNTTRKGYLRFDLADVKSDVLAAGLALDVSLNNNGGGGTTPQEFTVQVFGLNDGDAGESWAENLINFNNAPGNQSGNNLDGAATTLLGTFTVENNAGGRVMFSSDELVDFLNDDSNDLATLILLRQGGSGGFNLGFASRENGQLLAPTLELVTEAIPEPATATLALFGLAAMARRRRQAA